MYKRVALGPDDDPDEHWYECPDCEGVGQMSFPTADDDGNLQDGVVELGPCPGCDGLGFFEGDA